MNTFVVVLRDKSDIQWGVVYTLRPSMASIAKDALFHAFMNFFPRQEGDVLSDFLLSVKAFSTAFYGTHRDLLEDMTNLVEPLSELHSSAIDIDINVGNGMVNVLCKVPAIVESIKVNLIAHDE